MQGKEVSKQQGPAQSSAGVDISKSWLDAHVVPEGKSLRVPNSRVGICELKRWLLRFGPRLVAVEATGKWHRELCRSLHASAIAVAVTNPYRVRMFAKAEGTLAKGDRLDARTLARFAAVMAPPSRVPDSRLIEELKELATARDSAVAEQTALKNQLAAAASTFLKRQLVRRIKHLAEDIKALAGETLERIKSDGDLARRYEILRSIPSFGPVVATTLIAHLAELGSLSIKQVALLAGLAPIADDSGKREGVRVVYGGRPVLRRSLYLAALTAARCNPQMRSFYQRLRGTGKKPKAAIIAVARKLAVLANILIAQDRTWQLHAPQPA